MKKLFWWFFKIMGLILAVFLIVGVLFLYLSPQFGGQVTEEQKRAYEKTGHFANGVFLNAQEITMSMDCHSIMQMIKEMFTPDPNVVPKENIKVQKIMPDRLHESDSLVRITWLGHSAFLIEFEGKNILLDPIFGKYAAPHPLLGRERFNKEMPIEIEDLPHIDAVIISHDHYDHLDYPSIEKMKEKADRFFVPLGVGNHLRRWEVQPDRIYELDWWQEVSFEGLTLVFTPSRHMSGRGLSDRYATLWGSWVIRGGSKNIYFSGDGGYGKHFKEIGQRYGPFDIGLMECGQYNKLWADVHMLPEQTVQAAQDVRAKMILPIHWGAFSLAPHSWTDPIERVTAQAQKLKFPITTPQIGEPVVLGSVNYPTSKWWLGFE